MPYDLAMDWLKPARTRPYTLGVAMAAIVAAVDHLTGMAIRVHSLYFAPIVLVAWYGRGRSAFWMAGGCTCAWVLANRLGVCSDWPWWVGMVNVCTQATAFCVVTWLAKKLRDTMDLEQVLGRTDVRQRTCGLPSNAPMP